MSTRELTPRFDSLLRLAGPLVLTMSGMTLMQFVDTLFVSWYSPQALAAIMPAGIAAWTCICLFQNTAAYCATFVAQYQGAGRVQRIPQVVWQGIYFAGFSGLVLLGLSFGSTALFTFVGHDPSVIALESDYFAITLRGSFFFVAFAAVQGFFYGRGHTKQILAIQTTAFAINAFLDYILIFGKFGFPSMGLNGAALASVIAQAMGCLVGFALFLSRKNRREFGTWRNRQFEWALLKRLVRFGLPSGARYTIEVLAWTLFVFFMGRVSTEAMALTGVAFRINGLSFMPVLGISQAVGILVGTFQGSKQPKNSHAATMRGFVLCQSWMLMCAALFFLAPRLLLSPFTSDPQTGHAQYLLTMGPTILRFVALYCLLDGLNIVFLSSLQSAGDTRWTLWCSLILNVLFCGLLIYADTARWGLIPFWEAATAFVMLQSLIWLARYMSGKWKTMQVIEEQLIETA